MDGNRRDRMGGRGVGAERGFAAGVGRGTRTRLCAEGYGRLVRAEDVSGLPGWGGACCFIGLTAEPYHTHTIWYGMMNTVGIFRMDRLVPEDLEIYTKQPHYFWLGEVGMSAMLAGVFAVPAGCYLAGRTGIALAFILAMIVFMPLFVFLPKLIQRGGCRRMPKRWSRRSGRMSR